MAKTQLELESENELLKSLLVEKTKKGMVGVDQPPPKRADRPAAGGGWIIETPNPAFFNNVQGIQFRFGQGIIDEDLPDADLKVEIFEKEYGYTATPKTAKELNDYRKALLSGAEMRPQPQKSLGEKLSQDVTIGGK